MKKAERRKKAGKGGKGGFGYAISLLANCNFVIISPQSYLRPKGCQWQKATDFFYFIFLMLITFEREVPQRSDASQHDHKSKGYPSKTSEAAFNMQRRIKAI